MGDIDSEEVKVEGNEIEKEEEKEGREGGIVLDMEVDVVCAVGKEEMERKEERGVEEVKEKDDDDDVDGDVDVDVSTDCAVITDVKSGANARDRSESENVSKGNHDTDNNHSDADNNKSRSNDNYKAGNKDVNDGNDNRTSSGSKSIPNDVMKNKIHPRMKVRHSSHHAALHTPL